MKFSTKNKETLAREVGVSERTVERWMRGDIIPTADRWVEVMRQCGVSPASCLLIAEQNHPEIFETETYWYLHKLLELIFDKLTNVDHIAQMLIDPRAASRDVSLIEDSWRANYARREAFLETEYERESLARINGRR